MHLSLVLRPTCADRDLVSAPPSPSARAACSGSGPKLEVGVVVQVTGSPKCSGNSAGNAGRVSQSAVWAGSGSRGAVLVALRHWTLMLVCVYTAVGGVMLRTGLVPRGLSVLGLIGYPALLVAAVLDMLRIVDTVAGLGLVELVPGGVFELRPADLGLFVR